MRHVSIFLGVVFMVSASSGSHAAITISNPVFGAGGGVATSATFSASATLGQPVTGIAIGSSIAVVSGLSPSISGTTVGAPADKAPLVTSLDKIRPNPFGAAASITFDVAMRAQTVVRIFDVNGRRVRTLIEERLEPGRYRTEWNGTTRSGVRLDAGMYFCHFQCGTVNETRRIVLIR
jgi:hypothetical protein